MALHLTRNASGSDSKSDCERPGRLDTSDRTGEATLAERERARTGEWGEGLGGRDGERGRPKKVPTQGETA